MTTATQQISQNIVNAPRSLMLIGGKAVESSDGRFIDVENPATRTVIASVPRGTEADVDAAVRAAVAAFEAWKRVTPKDRGRMLLRIADLVEAETESIARTVALETGNAIRTQARPEVKSSAEVIRYYGGLTGETKGETVPLGEHVLSYTRREPIGVVGGIVPWNAPVVLGTLKIAMAIAAGNTLVLKAAEDAPLGLLRVAQLCNEHLPPGVLNLLTGYGEETGAALARHPLVRKLSFTGSTEVGKLIMHAAADRIVPVSLELGGKSPAIVFPDVDEQRTVDGVITGMRVTRQGQSCTAGSRLFLHRSIFDSFVSKLTATLQKLKIGDPSDEATDMGAIINRKQFDRVIGEFQALQHRAAELFCDLELTRAIVRQALQAVDEGAKNAPLLVAQAKARACLTANRAVQEGVQMHGGIGVTDELDMGLFMKRARVLQELFGDAAVQIDRAAVMAGY